MRKLIYAINITLDGCCDQSKIFESGCIALRYLKQ
jgi:hypothetical protein